MPIVPRGGGTGFTGGAVPLDGGVVLSLERLTKIRHLDPGLWRAAPEAGVITADLRRRARENGLLFPPDPGSAEQSQLGGNIATNAGGPHAFKYGVTGAWVTGLEVVLAPGELVTIGGPIRKDVAGYDLKSLLIGSEGTLGVVTAAWVKLIPAPEAALPLAAALRRHARPGAPRSKTPWPAASSPPRSSISTPAPSRRPAARSRSTCPDEAALHGDRRRRRLGRGGGENPLRADRGPERERAPRPRPDRSQGRSTRCGAGATARRSA